jgi:hypothetical protein
MRRHLVAPAQMPTQFCQAKMGRKLDGSIASDI